MACASPRVATQHTQQHSYPAHWLEQSPESLNQVIQYIGPEQLYQAYLEDQTSAKRSIAQPFIHPGIQKPPGLSPGDRIRLWLPSNQWANGVFGSAMDVYSGLYEIGMNGYLKLPFLPPIQAFSMKPHELEAVINANLEHKQIYQKGMANVSITVQEWAPITVFVNGAVFNEGQVVINHRSQEEASKDFNTQGETLALSRKLSSALLATGGVRPDADISRIEIVRASGTLIADLRGLVEGYPTEDFKLMHGDFIRVPSLGLPQSGLFSPSPITPPGLRIYISNLTVPALNNASSAVGRHSTSLPYGSRLHTAAISGNCAGGSASTNSDRTVVLVTRDPVRQTPITIERQIEDLLKQPGNAGINPYLLPNDSIVCYDSEVSNLRDIARTIRDLLLPIPFL